MKLLTSVKREYITEKWNDFSSSRLEQLISGVDISYKEVLEPAIKSSLESTKKITRILDLGCGVGVLTKYYSKIASEVVGIDPAAVSIKNAAEYCDGVKNIKFVNSYMEDYNSEEKFDVIISNMVLMDTLNIEGVLSSVSRNLILNGAFIFTITHPCFYPIYYKYDEKDWFNYSQELIIENDFTISKETSSYKTIHIHRPIELYLNLLNKNNLSIVECKELSGSNFKFPKFIIIKCQKI